MQALIILILTAAFLVAPAVTPPFTGYDPTLFPVQIARPSIQPAGYAFGIWGVIYLWLLVSAVTGLWRRNDPGWQAARPPLMGALALGSFWLAIAAGFPLTATLAIVAMAGFALWAFLAAPPLQDRWTLQAPLGLFAGWLTAASAVSLGVMVAGYGLLSDTATALTLLTVALLTAATIQFRRPTMPSYSAAVVWASVGVGVVNWQDNTTVAYAAVAGAALLATLALTFLTRATISSKKS